MTAQDPYHPRRWRTVLAATASAFLLAAAAGCSGSSLNSTPAAPAGPVKIGLMVSLSGTYQSVGEDMKKGWDLYLSTHAQKLGGHPVNVVVADEGEGSGVVVAPVTKLVKEDKVQALVGIVGGGSVAAAQPILTEAKVPLIGSNGRPTTMKDVSFVWHTSFLSTEPGIAMAQYVKQQVNGPVYAIGPDYQGGWDELNGFTDAFTKAGGQLANPNGKTTWTPFPATTNFGPYLQQIQASNAKAVYTFYAGAAAVAFVKQYKEFGLAGKIPLYSAGFLTEGGVLGAQGDAAAGIRNSLNYAADLDNPTNRAFAAAYQSAYKTLPTTYAMATYDAAAVLDKAIGTIKGDVTGESINTAIAAIGQIDSPRGTWQFSTGHTPVQRWYLREVQADGPSLSNVVVQDLMTLGS
jgi:branched-chain amino acid transport system substrate-binding protein